MLKKFTVTIEKTVTFNTTVWADSEDDVWRMPELAITEITAEDNLGYCDSFSDETLSVGSVDEEFLEENDTPEDGDWVMKKQPWDAMWPDLFTGSGPK